MVLIVTSAQYSAAMYMFHGDRFMHACSSFGSSVSA
jgi:hypothetical protein